MPFSLLMKCNEVLASNAEALSRRKHIDLTRLLRTESQFSDDKIKLQRASGIKGVSRTVKNHLKVEEKLNATTSVLDTICQEACKDKIIDGMFQFVDSSADEQDGNSLAMERKHSLGTLLLAAIGRDEPGFVDEVLAQWTQILGGTKAILEEKEKFISSAVQGKRVLQPTTFQDPSKRVPAKRRVTNFSDRELQELAMSESPQKKLKLSKASSSGMQRENDSGEWSSRQVAPAHRHSASVFEPMSPPLNPPSFTLPSYNALAVHVPLRSTSAPPQIRPLPTLPIRSTTVSTEHVTTAHEQSGEEGHVEVSLRGSRSPTPHALASQQSFVSAPISPRLPSYDSAVGALTAAFAPQSPPSNSLAILPTMDSQDMSALSAVVESGNHAQRTRSQLLRASSQVPSIANAAPSTDVTHESVSTPGSSSFEQSNLLSRPSCAVSPSIASAPLHPDPSAASALCLSIPAPSESMPTQSTLAPGTTAVLVEPIEAPIPSRNENLTGNVTQPEYSDTCSSAESKSGFPPSSGRLASENLNVSSAEGQLEAPAEPTESFSLPAPLPELTSTSTSTSTTTSTTTTTVTSTSTPTASSDSDASNLNAPPLPMTSGQASPVVNNFHFHFYQQPPSAPMPSRPPGFWLWHAYDDFVSEDS